MLCEQCKEREAVVHVTTVEAGELKKRNLCEPCYDSSRVEEQTGVDLGWICSDEHIKPFRHDESGR